MTGDEVSAPQFQFIACYHSPRPRINARHFEAIMPSTGVSALILRACTHAMPVRFTVFPTSTERSAVLEIEPAATDLCFLL